MNQIKKIYLFYFFIFLLMMVFPVFANAASQEWINSCRESCKQNWDVPECYAWCDSGGTIRPAGGTVGMTEGGALRLGSSNQCVGSKDVYCLNAPIGGLTEVNIKTENPLYKYISVWYGFIIGSIGILATVMIMYGGFKWLTSRGNSSQISDAKEKIISAITGLLLAFLSYTILNLINPRLVQITTPGADQLTPINYAQNFQVGNLSFGNGTITSGSPNDLLIIPITGTPGQPNSESQIPPVTFANPMQGSSRDEFINSSVRNLSLLDAPIPLSNVTPREHYGRIYDNLRTEYPDALIFPFSGNGLDNDDSLFIMDFFDANQVNTRGDDELFQWGALIIR
ncbi:MAG: pilin [Patescibacteria group bacterium]